MYSAYREKMNLPFADATGQIQKPNWVLLGSAACEIKVVKLTVDKRGRWASMGRTTEAAAPVETISYTEWHLQENTVILIC